MLLIVSLNENDNIGDNEEKQFTANLETLGVGSPIILGISFIIVVLLLIFSVLYFKQRDRNSRREGTRSRSSWLQKWKCRMTDNFTEIVSSVCGGALFASSSSSSSLTASASTSSAASSGLGASSRVFRRRV